MAHDRAGLVGEARLDVGEALPDDVLALASGEGEVAFVGGDQAELAVSAQLPAGDRSLGPGHGGGQHLGGGDRRETPGTSCLVCDFAAHWSVSLRIGPPQPAL